MTLQNLSIRAQENLQDTNVMLEGIIRANSNKFHIKTNPTGIINLGVAENQLMTRELSEIVCISPPKKTHGRACASIDLSMH
jgi:hypothetical protein